GADNYSISGNFNGTPSAGIALRLAPGGNLLETVDNVRAVLDAQEPFLPDGVKIIYPYDTTPVVEASISSVVMTILEAILLVFLVMYLFLQSFRATLIPTLAVPVVLLGAFALLPLFGLNINVLTMYAMVLAIGLLVDDAIAVVEASISSVVMTILEAILLVFLVMYLFLQSFRATLIPTLAVPVVLLGAFALLPLFGLNINVLTMYAMVLAIGLLVDDAIVVVENVERLMHDEGLSPLEATRKSMHQIKGALVGIGMVLSAVFVPMAFFGGSAGIIYRQFAITIVICMTLSVLVALIFTPALCATILKAPKPGALVEKKGFFGWFNRTFDRGPQRFERGAGGMLKRRGRYLMMFLLIVVGTGFLFKQIPAAFLPDEDQSLLMVEVRMPANSSAERTEAVLTEIREHLLEDESAIIASVQTVNGFNFA